MSAASDLRRAEAVLTELLATYAKHGCTPAETEDMESVVKARRNVEFLRGRKGGRR